MAEASDLSWRATEILTCQMCLKEFKNAKMLPCVHSFCLDCLQGHCKDKAPGDDVACPVCQKEFRIPDTELEALPHNFFIQNLIDARDDINRLQQELRSALDSETSLQKQLEQNQAKEKQRNYRMRKAKSDAKKKEKQMRVKLKLASETERDLRRQVTELQQQQLQQVAGAHERTQEKTVKSFNKTAGHSKPGTFPSMLC